MLARSLGIARHMVLTVGHVAAGSSPPRPSACGEVASSSYSRVRATPPGAAPASAVVSASPPPATLLLAAAESRDGWWRSCSSPGEARTASHVHRGGGAAARAAVGEAVNDPRHEARDCPLRCGLCAKVSRLEGGRAVRARDGRGAGDPAFGAQHLERHLDVRARLAVGALDEPPASIGALPHRRVAVKGSPRAVVVRGRRGRVGHCRYLRRAEGVEVTWDLHDAAVATCRSAWHAVYERVGG